jgi:hypothetical protein
VKKEAIVIGTLFLIGAHVKDSRMKVRETNKWDKTELVLSRFEGDSRYIRMASSLLPGRIPQSLGIKTRTGLNFDED